MPPMSTPGVQLAAPGYTLGTTNTKGSAVTVAPTDSTLLAFDVTVPTTITSGASAATGSAVVAARRDHTHGAPTLASAPTLNYKSATQTFSATSTFADVTGALGATFSFTIAANEIWEAYYWIPVTTFTGTGGLKLQITGPSSPSGVNITGTVARNLGFGPTDNLSKIVPIPFAPITAFSSGFVTGAAVATQSNADDGTYYTGSSSQYVEIYARVINGANAGTVTLQGAQNGANGTTVLGLGCFMQAQKVA